MKAGPIGRGGQKFLYRCVPKVSELRARFPDKDIEVDGGVGPKTIGVCADAGTSIGRETRGERSLTCSLSLAKGATSLWLEQPSSGRRIRRMSSPPSNPPLTRLRTRLLPGRDVSWLDLYQGQLLPVLNCSRYICKNSRSVIPCCLEEMRSLPIQSLV